MGTGFCPLPVHSSADGKMVSDKSNSRSQSVSAFTICVNITVFGKKCIKTVEHSMVGKHSVECLLEWLKFYADA